MAQTKARLRVLVRQTTNIDNFQPCLGSSLDGERTHHIHPTVDAGRQQSSCHSFRLVFRASKISKDGIENILFAADDLVHRMSDGD